MAGKLIGYVFHHFPDIDLITKKFKSAARACGISGVSFHKLRHMAAMQMLASGIDIRYVQEALGHADLKTTEIYAKILQDRLKVEFQKFSY